MMLYEVFGLTQHSKKQGVRATEVVEVILEGTRPTDFPVSSNHQITVWISTRLARRIGVEPDKELLRNATIVTLNRLKTYTARYCRPQMR